YKFLAEPTLAAYRKTRGQLPRQAFKAQYSAQILDNGNWFIQDVSVNPLSTSKRDGANHRSPPFLRACRERPRSRRAAEQRDEPASLDHSITSSARARSVGGTSRPSALAVLRLMINSTLVAC